MSKFTYHSPTIPLNHAGFKMTENMKIGIKYQAALVHHIEVN
jgi:hypothetical protein